MYEMGLIIRSQVINEDISRTKAESLINNLYKEAVITQTPDQIQAGLPATITGDRLNEAYKEEFGVIPNYTGQVTTSNHIDALDFYAKDIDQVRSN